MKPEIEKEINQKVDEIIKNLEALGEFLPENNILLKPGVAKAVIKKNGEKINEYKLTPELLKKQYKQQFKKSLIANYKERGLL